MDIHFIHHGAREGVTGSCHELFLPNGKSLLVDIGLFQGAETSGEGADSNHQEIEFSLNAVQALILTHCHIDHVGRLPWLLIAGFRKPIYCTRATAHLLPMVIEDALKIGLTRNPQLINSVLRIVAELLVPVDYDTWQHLPEVGANIRFRQAGHILGSSFVEVDIPGLESGFDLGGSGNAAHSDPAADSGLDDATVGDRPGNAALADADLDDAAVGGRPGNAALSTGLDAGMAVTADLTTAPRPYRVVFSGDLGCKNTPLLPDPAALEYADVLILESTYGNRNHENRSERQQRLKTVVEHCIRDRGAVLIPAFSIGRTQELLYELEDIIYQCQQSGIPDCEWQDMVVILDSPMAAQFTKQYRRMRDLWDAEAKDKLADQRHPLNFERMHIVDSHSQHESLVEYLHSSADPCIVIAASGMCTGGRMVNYLKALLPDPRTDVLFVGYQAQGTPGRDIQQYGPRGGYVDLDRERIYIKAKVHTLGGYSAHADQQELTDFVGSAQYVGEIRLVHGDPPAKSTLAHHLRQHFNSEVVIP
ncbi:MBL fold metallo-hydrolase RNA specificity domain-containing protein [Aliidiomarina celeris]|uniref:MBL fold metallo-hydrolase RNA specificity domain-containing protein n=1 Tax=Aliidiomarina celeris TaxID=2249428 RepID=UPI000DE85AC1|nr:MBL fold metallo-hydrolase [Aliidiomarina celeris]